MQVSVTEFSEMVTDFGVNVEINWSALSVPNNLD